MNAPEQGRLRHAALLTLTIHAVAGTAMLLVLKRGLSTNPDLVDRMNFLAQETAIWRAAWFTWNLAALSILYFFMRMTQAHAMDDERTIRRCRTALAIGTIAVIFDLSAEWLMMFSLPTIAQAHDTAAFLRLDHIAVILTGGIANGLYTLATAIYALSTRRSYPTWTWAAGIGVGFAGSLLSLSACLDSVTGLVLTNAALIPLLNLWLLGVAVRPARTEKR